MVILFLVVGNKILVDKAVCEFQFSEQNTVANPCNTLFARHVIAHGIYLRDLL